jgi:hypothetical protein
MDIKQRLQQAIEKQRVVALDPVDQLRLCQDALARIEALENPNVTLVLSHTELKILSSAIRELINATGWCQRSPEVQRVIQWMASRGG